MENDEMQGWTVGPVAPVKPAGEDDPMQGWTVGSSEDKAPTAEDPTMQGWTIGEAQSSAEPAAVPPVAEAPAGSVWNRFKEAAGKVADATIIPAAAKVMEVTESIGNKLEGTTPEQALQAEITAKTMHMPQVPGADPAKMFNNGVLPSWDQRLIMRDKLEADKAAFDAGQLTPTQAAKYQEDKDTAERYNRLAPLPKAPAQKNAGLGGMTAVITDEELGAIAHQYGADTNFLLGNLALEGVNLEATPGQKSSFMDSLVGGQIEAVGVLDSAAMGLGKYINRVTATPADRRALEAIRRLATARQSHARTVAEFASGAALNLGTTAIGKGIATGVAPKVAAFTKLSPAATERILKTTADWTDNIVQSAGAGMTQTEMGKSPTANAMQGALMGAAATAGLVGVGKAAGSATKLVPTLVKAKNVAAAAGDPKLYEEALTEAAKTRTLRTQKLYTAIQDTLNGSKVANPDDLVAVAQKLGSTATTGEDAGKFLAMQAQREPASLATALHEVSVKQAFDEKLKARLDQSPGSRSVLGRVLDVVSASPWVAAVYDRKHGTNGMQLIDLMGADSRIAGVTKNAWAERAEDQVFSKLREFKAARAPNMAEDEFMAKMFDGLNRGSAPKEVQDSFGKFFEEFRQYINHLDADPATGLARVNISHISQGKSGAQAYVPNTMKRGVDFILALEKQAGAAGEYAVRSGVNGKTTQASLNLVKQSFDKSGITEALEDLSGKKLLTPMDVIQEYRAAVSLEKNPLGTAESQARMANALKQRKPGGPHIPEWLMEKNLAKVTMNYMDDMLSQVYVEPHVRKLEHLRDIMGRESPSGKFDPNAHAFYDNIVTGLRYGGENSLLNIGKTTRQAFNKFEHFGKVQAMQAKYPAEKAMWNTLATLPPRAIAQMKSFMYQNFIGISNLKAPLQNIAQPVLMGVPELGEGYGASVALRSLDELRMSPMFKSGRGQLDAAHTAGFTSEAPNDEVMRLMRGELEKQGFAGKALDRAGEVTLGLFTLSERISRNWSYAMGNKVADDLLAGHAGAMNFVKKMPGTYGKAVEAELARAQATGDARYVRRMVSEYLTARTTLDYSKNAQSEFVRNLGPLLNSFSRWPAEGMGQLNYALRSGQKFRETAAFGQLRVIAYLWALEAGAQSMSGYENMKKESGRYRALVGSRGLTSWAGGAAPAEMIQSALGLGGVGQSVFTSPIIEAGGALAGGALQAGAAVSKGAEEGDPEMEKAEMALAKGIDAMSGVGVPGIAWVNLFQRTGPMVMGKYEHEPEQPAAGILQRRVQNSR